MRQIKCGEIRDKIRCSGQYFLIFWLWTGGVFGLLGEGVRAEETSSSDLWNRVKEEVLGFFETFDTYLGRTRFLSTDDLQTLPVGLQTKIGSTTCDLLVTEAAFGADYTELTAFLRVTTPAYNGGETKLYFGAEHIRISAKGGIIGDLKLALMSEVIIGGKGDAFKFILDPAGRGGGLPPTYAKVGCNGFEEMQINGRIIIPQKYAKPVFNGKPLHNRELEIPFSCTAQSPDQILAEVEVPEFALTAMPDWRFGVKRAIFDFNTQENAPSMTMLNKQDYGGNPEIWTGLYIERFTVHFPSYIKNKVSGSPAFEAQHLWLDENGFSGIMAAKDLLNITNGRIDGWLFSVDEIDMTLVHNRVKKGSMNGRIGVPICGGTTFGYDAEFDTDGNWQLKAKMGERTAFDSWKALEVELYASSYIKVEKKASDTSVLLLANFSGKMKLDPSAKSSNENGAEGTSGAGGTTESESTKKKGKFDFGEVVFHNLKVSNRKPYLEIGKFEHQNKSQFANFPVSIDKVGFEIKDDKSSLTFGAKVDLMKLSQNVNFVGDLECSIQSVYKAPSPDSAARWVFDDFKLKDLNVDFSTQVFALKGKAKMFENDKDYGNGFSGELEFKMKTGLEFGLSSKVMFGAMPTYRYWYADMMANFAGAGIVIYPGFQISGLGGGCYHRMRMDTDKEGPNLGERVTQTGIRYVPDSTKGLGLKAYCELSTQSSPDMFKADLALSAGFLAGGGLDHITFQGVAKFMNTPALSAAADMSGKVANIINAKNEQWNSMRKAASQDAAITATALLTYDNKNQSFYGLFDAYLQMGLIQGTGTDGHVGACELYFSKPKWFINIGHPDKRLGLKMDLGLINVKANSYFVTGNDLPAMPPLPSKLQRLLTPNEIQRATTRPVTEIKGGQGFAFGSAISVNTGNLNFWLLYAKFESEIGFDVMMKKYKGVSCNGRSEVLGLNGWYATGQAYAYLYGSVGLRANLFGQERNFTVLQGEVGALLEAQLPRPAYFGGSFGVNFSVLGGLLHGNCQFKFSLGEKCEIIESGFADGTEVIADMRPGDKTTDVDVFTIPQTAFNLPIDKELEAVFDGEDKPVRIRLSEYDLSSEGRGSSANGTVGAGVSVGTKKKWNDDKKVVQNIPNEALTPYTTYTLKAMVLAQEKKGGRWQDLKTVKGETYTETRQLSFTTGAAPDSIPMRNVVQMYPVPGQHYLYVDECRRGWVTLGTGQSYLLDDEGYLKRVQFINESGDTLSSTFTYNKGEKRIRFNLPDLKPNQHYTVQLVMTPKKENNSSGGGVTNTKSEQRDGNNVLFTTKTTLTGDVLQEKRDKLILRTEFSTSRYRTLADKMKAVVPGQVQRVPYMQLMSDGRYQPSPMVHYLQAPMRAVEGFDEVELRGSAFSEPLIEARAALVQEPYYQNQIYPLVYEQYPYGENVTFARNPEHPEIVPDWAVYVSSYYKDERKDLFPWMYYLPYHYYRDYHAVIAGVAAMSSAQRRNTGYGAWLNKPFVPIPNGLYPIRFVYRLPDGSKGISESEVVMKNDVK